MILELDVVNTVYAVLIILLYFQTMVLFIVCHEHKKSMDSMEEQMLLLEKNYKTVLKDFEESIRYIIKDMSEQLEKLKNEQPNNRV